MSVHSAGSRPDVLPIDERSDGFFTFPHESLRHSTSLRSVAAHTHVHSATTAQSAILENGEADAAYDALDTCPPTPRDPFLTPAHSPTSSTPGSTHNLTLSRLTGATASRLSIHSPAYGFAGLANGQGVSTGHGPHKGTSVAESTTLSRVSTAPGTLSGSSTVPTIPPLPHLHARSSRAAGSVDLAAATGSGAPPGKRESFAAPPKMMRPPSAVSFNAPNRRMSQRPGTSGTTGTTGTTAHLTPPGSASASSLSEKAALGVAFRANDARKVYGAKRMECTMLESETVIEKPWMEKPNVLSRVSYWLTYSVAFIGVVGTFLRIWFGVKDVPLLQGNLCPVFEDDFDGDSIDATKWSWDVAMDGFGNGEFEMMTNSPNNSFVQDGILYIVPTLTSNVIGSDAIFNGHTFNITGCTSTNASACGAVSNQTTKAVINPVQSARLTTVNSSSIRYGKVEIRAKIPTGDWLWPALWMLPVDDTYGPWPISGEIDIMEARGNSRSYPRQGVDYVRAALNWGPLTWLNEAFRTYGFWPARRSTYNQEFHTYTLEWSDKFIRAYVDTRLHLTLDIPFNLPFFDRGIFPPTVTNGSSDIPVPNPWGLDSYSAPFDQSFYLIMNVAVGGTNGWFPDNVGDKPWLDQSDSAMYEFAKSQDQWYSTWPEDVRERGMAVDYVKMWQLC